MLQRSPALQAMVYIHHNKEKQCLTLHWLMWKRWLMEKMIIKALYMEILLGQDFVVVLVLQELAQLPNVQIVNKFKYSYRIGEFSYAYFQ